MTAAPQTPTDGQRAGAGDHTPAPADLARAWWLAWRRGGIGGSDIAGLLLPGNWSSPWKVWAEKVGLLPPTESTQRQRIGHFMEAALANMLEYERPGLSTYGSQEMCVHPEHPWARVTIDARGSDIDGPEALVEFKTDGRFGWPDGPPPNYRAQCIWGMGVTGLRHAYLAVLFAGFRFEVFEIPWDDSAQADWDLMLTTADRFWHDHVVTGTPPPVDGSDATTDALATVYPDHTPGESVELDGMSGLLVERDDLKDAAKTTKARLAEIENEIKARLGDAEIGAVNGIPVVTLRTQTRASYTVAESTYRVLRNAPAPKKGKQ